MKKVILLVSFGTSYKEAGENSLKAIYEDMVRAGGGLPVYEAYTSGVVIHRLAKEGIRISSVQEALQDIIENGGEILYVISTHMIPGIEYEKLLGILEKYKSRFHKVLVAAPVLGREEDCGKLVPVIRKLLSVRDDYEYVLMGHGTEAEANVRYHQMNEAFLKAGIGNIRIASVEAKPDIADALMHLSEKKKVEKVILHPFMIVAGDHAFNDMAGEGDSYLTCLTNAGYRVEAIVKGLGEYADFRQVFADKLEELINEP